MRSMLALIVLTCLMPPAQAQSGDVLDGWTRLGSIYQRVDMDGGTARACAVLCNDDTQCRSWVWSQSGLAGPYNTCALLSGVPTPRPAPGRVTGLSTRITSHIEAASIRPPSEREIKGLEAASELQLRPDR